MGMDYVFFVELGLAGTAGIYAFYQLADYCVQKSKFLVIDSGRAIEKAEGLLSHTSSLAEKIVFAGRRYAAKVYLKTPNFL